MKVKELLKELKKLDKDAEIDLINCFNPECPCAKDEGGVCDSKGCTYTAYDIYHIAEYKEDKEDKTVAFWINAYDGWDYDKDGELIKEN